MSILFSNLLGIGQSNTVQATQALSQATQAPQVVAQPNAMESRPSTVVSISQAGYEALAKEQTQQVLSPQANDAATSAQSSQMVQLKQLPAYLFQVNET
ncbi:hypothetical protein ACKC9G_06795 [Pokkaliibacter sp. CJK22405]|uniref:hypothetical protein n=1 Tax=Pokkaliibacter sp. CJK22405 TaxID=3384615 RepID=UPI0039856752